MTTTLTRPQPSGVRARLTMLGATLGVFVTAGLLFGSVTPAYAVSEADQVSALVDNLRASEGAPALQRTGSLDAAATAWADALATGATRHSGFSLPNRIVAENVHIGSGDAAGAVAAWSASPPDLANLLNGGFTETGIGHNATGNTWVQIFTGEPDTSVRWPLSKIVYDSTIYELVGTSQEATPLSYERWRDVYKFQNPTASATDFVKYPWSATVYAVTFWPGGESKWMWTPLSFAQWQTAGKPAPRNAGWIKGSYYYKWSTSSEIFVEGADGVNHKLSYGEWVDSGSRNFIDRAGEGFLKLSWAPDFARMSNVNSGAGRPMGYAEWQEEAFPTPMAVQRIAGDSFYKDCGSATVWYAGPGLNRPVNFQEWQAAGSPAPSVRNAPCAGNTAPPAQPGNPGNSVNCPDFGSQAEAQAWFNRHYPAYGDVALLDADNDGIACESN